MSWVMNQLSVCLNVSSSGSARVALEHCWSSSVSTLTLGSRNKSCTSSTTTRSTRWVSTGIGARCPSQTRTSWPWRRHRAISSAEMYQAVSEQWTARSAFSSSFVTRLNGPSPTTHNYTKPERNGASRQPGETHSQTCKPTCSPHPTPQNNSNEMQKLEIMNDMRCVQWSWKSEILWNDLRRGDVEELSIVWKRLHLQNKILCFRMLE